MNLRILKNKQGQFAFEDTSRAFFIIRNDWNGPDIRLEWPKKVLYGLNWSRI
jgi:hypothetical protein